MERMTDYSAGEQPDTGSSWANKSQDIITRHQQFLKKLRTLLTGDINDFSKLLKIL
jgi:hypothetical protein